MLFQQYIVGISEVGIAIMWFCGLAFNLQNVYEHSSHTVSWNLVQNLMSRICFPCAYCVRVANLRGYGLLKVQTIVKQFNCD